MGTRGTRGTNYFYPEINELQGVKVSEFRRDCAREAFVTHLRFDTVGLEKRLDLRQAPSR